MSATQAPEVSQDIALSPQGWAYRTGRENRTPRLVIRVRKDGPADSKQASSILNIPFEDRGQQEWSSKELETSNSYQADLAIVVGELLPKNYIADPKKLKKARSPNQFKHGVHDLVEPAEKTGILVKLLSQKLCSLYLLYNKNNGLHCFAPMPNTEVEDRIVYYKEWTDNVFDTQEKKLRNSYHANIVNFKKAYVEDPDNEFLDVSRSSTIKDSWDHELTIRPKKTLFSMIRQGIAAWDEPEGDSGHLKQVYDTIMDAVGKVDWEDHTEIEESVEILQRMIEGRDKFDLDEAKEAVAACAALWSEKPDAKIILDLARGLREGALPNTLIDEYLYRPFIKLFCTTYAKGGLQEGKSLHEAIQNAYKLAKDVGQPLPAMRSTTKDDNQRNLVTLVAKTVLLKRSQLAAIKTRRAAEQAEFSGGLTTEVTSVAKLLSQVSESMDFNHCHNALNQVVQMGFMRTDLFAQEITTMFSNELRGWTELLKVLGVDELEDEDEGEDGDEDMEVANAPEA
ncbi:hypothetical protein NM208_g9692 [Fusarium decemcellulare]|uniref:Uncharacterized protein n=1 Tax=Fusarium decemcellulare TaxID=57161 RepID=A0ACC1S0M0_9HYPO|nr:hypothetical protein NM208_g9692 [Fusarium decemcellulare]